MLHKLFNPTKQEEVYELPQDTRHIHNIMCACNHPRCFGYTPIKWQRMLAVK